MIHVPRRQSVPIAAAHAHEPDFHETMAEQLRRAPWLLLSLTIHALAVLMLLLLPPTPLLRELARVDVRVAELPPVESPELPPPPELRPEPPRDPVLQDTPTEQPAEQPGDDPSPSDLADRPSPLQPSAAPLGLGPGSRPGMHKRRGTGGDGGGGGPRGPQHDALGWLARHQDADGRWDTDGFMKHDRDGVPCDGPGNPVHDVGITGLALLAFLGEGSTLRSGRWSEQIRAGAKWLRDQQEDNGRFGPATSHDFIYDHAIAAYAMVEAYGLSDYRTLREVAQRGIDYLESHRNPYSVWRYQPHDNDNDTSVTGWCIMACQSAVHFGLAVNPNALKLAAAWLDQVTTPDGRVGYTRAGEPSSRHPGEHGARFPVDKGEAMTAVGLFCRFFMGQEPSNVPAMQASADRILSRPPIWDTKAGTIDHYYWYYATYALYQMGGRPWEEWSRRLKPAVVDTQRKDGNFAGSWDPAGAWGADGGRVYATAILALTLQGHYRYTRLLR